MIKFIEEGIIVSPSDFYINIDQIVDRNGDPINLELSHFYFEFFGKDVYAEIMECDDYDPSEEVYVVSYDGITRKNNTFKDGVLRFKFEGYNICNSRLYYKQVEKYPDSEFSDNTEDVITIEGTNINIRPVGKNSLGGNEELYAIVSIAALKGEPGVISAEQIEQVTQDILDTLRPEIPTKTSELTNDSQFVNTDDSRLSDSRNAKDVYPWAKESNKPAYTAAEVGALPNSTVIPTNNNQLDNGAGYVDGEDVGSTIVGVSFNPTNGVLTFTSYNGSKGTVDLPTELMVEDGYYDSAAKEIVLVLANGSEIRIPAADLIKEYTGSNGEVIQISIDSGNVISAILKNGTIKEVHLAAEVAAKLNKSITWESISGKPTFAAVATSGQYSDLSGTPTIPSVEGLASVEYVDQEVGEKQDKLTSAQLTNLNNVPNKADKTYVDTELAKKSTKAAIVEFTTAAISIPANANNVDYYASVAVTSVSIGSGVDDVTLNFTAGANVTWSVGSLGWNGGVETEVGEGLIYNLAVYNGTIYIDYGR